MATTAHAPEGAIDKRFSDPSAKPRAWAEAVEHLEKAELYWMTTVRGDGRPHVAPLIGLWIDDGFHFCTGADEQKAKNIEANSHCVVTTGCNKWNEGFDVIVEGVAVRVTDRGGLQRMADAYVAKYGDVWRFGVGDRVLRNEEGGDAWAFVVRPKKAIGFGKAPHSQTTWRF
jgi:general stress protein 26